jgi:hypothetical protein
MNKETYYITGPSDIAQLTPMLEEMAAGNSDTAAEITLLDADGDPVSITVLPASTRPGYVAPADDQPAAS